MGKAADSADLPLFRNGSEIGEPHLRQPLLDHI